MHVGKGRAVLTSTNGESQEIHPGDVLSIHGQTGEVYFGSRPIKEISRTRSKPKKEPVVAPPAA